MATYALTEKAVVLRSEDDVAVAKAELPAGTILEDGGTRIEVRQDIRPGHKVARRAVATGVPVRRYGQVIGFATSDIAVGDHVHTQNLGIGDLSADRYEIGVDVRPVDFYPPAQMRTFDGYKRDDGRIGTRNYVAIISGVNCSASVSQFVKDRFRDVQKDFPNIICFTTGRGSVFGCKPVPSIKLATNSLMYRHMAEDMDINCGVVLEGTPIATVGRQIFEEVIAVASGKRSKSELSGVGEEEFAPWIIGPVM
jgi:hypothetical protein